MNALYQVKFKELFIEFTRYLIEYPEFACNIPAEAHIVLLDYTDPHYSLQAMQFAQRAYQIDDLPHRPVIYIEVREMAPIQSRLKNVQILTSPPQYAMA